MPSGYRIVAGNVSFGIAAHRSLFIVDPSGQVVARIDGIAFNPDGAQVSNGFGWLQGVNSLDPTRQIGFANVVGGEVGNVTNPGNTDINLENAIRSGHAVVLFGALGTPLTDVMQRWNAAQYAIGVLNSYNGGKGIPYFGLGDFPFNSAFDDNSNGFYSTMVLAMGLNDRPIPNDFPLVPGLGDVILPAWVIRGGWDANGIAPTSRAAQILRRRAALDLLRQFELGGHRPTSFSPGDFDGRPDTDLVGFSVQIAAYMTATNNNTGSC